VKAKYINPYTDFGFKKLFGEEGNKDLLADFLNQLLPDKHKIVNLTFKSPEQLGDINSDRRAIFDIHCQNDKGDRFIVEMQKAKHQFFKDRSIFYTTFPIRDQAEKGDWNFELKNFFWGGFYKATMSVSYQIGDNVEIGKENGQNILVVEGPSRWFFMPPALWAFIIELLILAVIVFIVFSCLMYRKRAKWIKNSWASHTVKAGDDIKSLASRFNVSWKLLAKANKITAPYTLKSGTKIQVPPKE